MCEIIVLLMTGVIVGILGHLLGIGGGVVIVPVLVLICHLPIHIAISASLITIVATSTAIASTNVANGIVNVNLGMLLELTTVICVVLGSFLSLTSSENILMFIFSGVIILTAISYLRNVNVDDVYNAKDYVNEYNSTVFDNNYYDERVGKNIYYKVRRLPLTIIISGVGGMLSGMLGVGGGILKVPAMNLISKMPIKVAAATSNFMIGITAAAGSIVYILYGKVDPKVASLMVLGVVLGSKFSIKRFSKIKDSRIRLLFVIVLIIVSLQMLLKGLG